MARTRPTTRRKIRTRGHVIAELAVNHVERQALLCGYSVERMIHDYGIDLVLFTYDAGGEIDNGTVLIQVKATEHAQVLAGGKTLSFRLSRSDLQNWLFQVFPVILIVYDVTADLAYWLHVQQHFASRRGFSLFRSGKTVSAHLPTSQVLDRGAIRHFATLRDQVLAQIRGGAGHV